MTMLLLSQPTTVAPGSGPAPAPAANTLQPSQGAPAAPPGLMDGPGMFLFLMLLMLAVTWFMTNRQNAKQKEVEATLKPGDVVVTQSGLIGKIVDLGEINAKLEIAPGVNIRVRKAMIQGLETEPKPAESTATKDKANEKKA